MQPGITPGNPGDLDAFNQLVAFHQDHLFGVAFRVVADREAAADAVQVSLDASIRLHAARLNPLRLADQLI